MSKILAEILYTAVFGFCVGCFVFGLGFHVAGLTFLGAGAVWLTVAVAGFGYVTARAIFRAIVRNLDAE